MKMLDRENYRIKTTKLKKLDHENFSNKDEDARLTKFPDKSNNGEYVSVNGTILLLGE